jgi:nitrite reductase/ring-hydroxylating ferredoxin subunit
MNDTGRFVSTDALRNFWHPVAWSDEITTTPKPVILLDERVVLYRTESGVAVVLRDLCVHRGTPLSLGWVEGENLVCAYHGWTYDTTGRCIRIPAIPDARSIPQKACVRSYKIIEQYGLVWVCLGEPIHSIADFPEYDDPTFRRYHRNADNWSSSAARLIENFMDAAHFPWVHPGILGNRDQPLVPPMTIEQGGGRIHVSLTMPASGALMTGKQSTEVWDEVTLPFCVRQVRTDALGAKNVIFLAVSPVTGKSLRRFIRYLRNFAVDQPDEPFISQAVLVQSQDQRMVEEQRPEELPVDLAEEMHVRGPDDPAVVYRRALAALGVDAP